MTTVLRNEKSFDSINTRRLAKQLVIVGRALADLADHDERIVAGSADLKFSTLLSEFEDRHPDRFFQFGISERNMVSAAAGMAACGLIPYVGTFAVLRRTALLRGHPDRPRLPLRPGPSAGHARWDFHGLFRHVTSRDRRPVGAAVDRPSDGPVTG